jgi:Family of unknown function (DUF5990)
MIVLIEASHLPGRHYGPNPNGDWYEHVHVGLCTRSRATGADAVVPNRPWSVVDLVPGDAPSARWEFDVTLRDTATRIDFAGPYVRGPRIDRHVGLAWGEVPGDGTFRLFRGVKLQFCDIPAQTMRDAMLPGGRLVGRFELSDANGDPRCARVRPPDITWSVEPV